MMWDNSNVHKTLLSPGLFISVLVTVNYTAQTNCFIEEIFGKQDFAPMSLMSQ